MSELRDQIATKLDDLKRREQSVIEKIVMQHQIVDVEELLRLFHMDVAIKSILEDRFERI